MLGLTATTLLSGTAASAAAGHAARPAATPRCTLSRLSVWIGVPGSGAAGSVAYPLEFSNVSGRACHLLGYPGVSAIGRRGQRLGSAAGRDPAFRPRLVILRRGGTAHALLTITDAGNFPARQLPDPPRGGAAGRRAAAAPTPRSSRSASRPVPGKARSTCISGSSGRVSASRGSASSNAPPILLNASAGYWR